MESAPSKNEAEEQAQQAYKKNPGIVIHDAFSWV
jgi:hypothetical protein